MTFDQLNIIDPILRAVENEGYLTPSPIQEQAIPVLLEGKDMLASAQTGTGKTAAFAIPIIQGLVSQEITVGSKKDIRALILAPTRELADQIKDSFKNYSKNLGIKTEVVYGGVSQKNQEKALAKGFDVLVATPGRLLDLMNQKLVSLAKVKYFVLDEADRMLDMGFVTDVRKIVKAIPKVRQTALFSATIPNEILSLANELLTNPVRIEVTPPEAMVDKIKQSMFYVSKKDKTHLLLDILADRSRKSILIFTRTKHGANKLVKELLSYGVKADAIHGNKSQSRRQTALLEFKVGKLRVLVATDIAARGIDIDELSHVINYDLPESAETYVHRMGRTGRAGLSGEAYSFCSPDETHLLAAMEKHIKMMIPVVSDHDYHIELNTHKKSTSQSVKKPSQNIKKNIKKEDSKPLKKNANEKQKKSYHALLEEQEFGKKEVFKRSEQPRKRVSAVKEDDAKKSKFAPASPELSKRNFDSRSYQPKEYGKEESGYKGRGGSERTRSSYAPKSADGTRNYTPRTSNDGSRPYTPRSTDGERTYTPRSTEGSRPYTPRAENAERSYQPRNSNDSFAKKPYAPRGTEGQSRNHSTNKKPSNYSK